MKANSQCVDDSGSRSLKHPKNLEKGSKEALRDVQLPFFLRWLDDWKRRASRSTNEESVRGC